MVRQRVAKSWDSGRLLASLVVGESATDDAEEADTFPLRIALTGPRGADLAARWTECRDWVRSHENAGGYRIEWREVNDRTLGRQRLPAAAWLDTIDDAAALCGVRRDLTRFRSALTETPTNLHDWVRAHPRKVLDVGEDWPLLIDVVEWLAEHPQPKVYLRQVEVPGVHTKVIETHRRTIASMADAVGIPSVAADGHGWFERRYGFLTKPAMVRFRLLDSSARLLPGVTEMTLRVTEAAHLRPAVSRVFVVENEINYLSFPEVAEAMVIFGQGNEAPSVLQGLPWLSDATAFYFGDLDTHGFAILDRVRVVLPEVQSLLMDRRTLLAHRHAWTIEPQQSTHDMVHLTGQEREVVELLRSNELGPGVRLEQERIGWQWLRDGVARCG